MTDDPEDYEAEWDDLDEKVILAQILTELQQIRMALPQRRDDYRENAHRPAVYECKKCDKTVKEAERARHAEKQHKAPPSMVTEMFEVVNR